MSSERAVDMTTSAVLVLTLAWFTNPTCLVSALSVDKAPAKIQMTQITQRPETKNQKRVVRSHGTLLTYTELCAKSTGNRSYCVAAQSNSSSLAPTFLIRDIEITFGF